ncbi:hypothetical protein GUE55_15300 [Listeria monocytogenes]|uniref:phage head-tail connector protein n=1 Tax=Listeria TaxID=1637 RepID=UPI000432B295|nr:MULTISPECIES: phage head-tail connector protein [Listeria]EAF3078621.1 hypothetical protein [Listeria monocytogenes serotype 1/2a]EAC6458722.1 hypothetical protein [Listeria monocytogenes]EAD6111674.1 hypothetical protein [Listeria monocytogenes]EAG3390972.1 hypothetical protein [Listeria monocytogenes]EAH4391811.1 hypothetical protein [Listeria monocytogenes]
MSIFNEVEEVKTILDIPDNDQDEVLTILISNIQKAILLIVGMEVTDVFPEELSFIAVEIACSRYQQLNSEGLKLESTDISRFDYESDIYAKYRQFLIRYKVANALGLGKLRML